MAHRRVVVTGLGCVSPVGNTVAESWSSLLAGRWALPPLPALMPVRWLAILLARSRGWMPLRGFYQRSQNDGYLHQIRFGQHTAEAVADAGLPTGRLCQEEQAERIGCVIGSGIGGAHDRRALRRVCAARPAASLRFRALVHHQYGGGPCIDQIWLQGAEPGHCHGMHNRPALHWRGWPPDCARRCRYRDCRRCRIDRIAVGGWRLCRDACRCPRATMTQRPHRALGTKTVTALCWGKEQVFSCWKSTSTPKARGAEIYAELAGFGMSADASHITAPSIVVLAEPCRPLRNAAGLNADQVPVRECARHLHPLGDINETKAIKAALGEHVYKTVVGSTKSMTGLPAGRCRWYRKRLLPCCRSTNKKCRLPSISSTRILSAIWTTAPTPHGI